MDNYDNDTAFFEMVNNNATAVKMEEKNKKKATEYFNAIDGAVQRSIKREDVKIDDERQMQIRVEKQRKLRVATLILAGSLIFGALTYGSKRISEQHDIKTVTTLATQDVKHDLLILLMYKCGGSSTIVDDVGLRNSFRSLSTRDYAMLSIDNLGQIYSYKLVLGDIEFEEFIKSLTYLENGEQRHYVSFKQFLNINGFGSEKEFINRAEAILLEEYGNELHKGKGGI